MSNATKVMLNEVNKALGEESVFVFENNIAVDDEHELDYTIVCTDDDEVYNTLQAMLDGIALCKAIEERKAR